MIEVLFGLLGCGTAADSYRASLSAADWESAATACADLASGPRDECLLAAMEAHDRREMADCDGLDALVDECRFRLAERHARHGEAALAMKTCTTTIYARECSYHLLREAARTVLDGGPGEAAGALAPWVHMPGAPDAARLFWKAWFREKVATTARESQGAPAEVDPTSCPDAACDLAARETMLSSLRGRADSTCSAPAVPAPWTDTAKTRQWVEAWSEQFCGAAPVGAATPAPVRAAPPGAGR